MQNFTLGKKEISKFLFILILMIGSSPLYSQEENCPTVSDNTQEFCYLATVADLDATAAGDGVNWYRSATSTTPIPENELLQDGSYFAGNESGTCSSRAEVVVTVNNPGAPSPSFGSFFQPCEYGTSDFTTVGDLEDLVDPTVEGYIIETYAEEFSGDPLPEDTQLQEGENYFVGQRDPNAPSCPSSRVAIAYSPVLAEAPTGEPLQTFCAGATVADLQAQATSEISQGFRWYSTADSNPPLDPSTPLVNGETYYASQIVNRIDRNQPPCESTDRFAVEVEVQQPVDLGTPETGVVCESDVQETFPDIEAIENYYLALLPEGTPTNGTFSPTPEEVGNQYTGPGNYTTTYTVGEGGCASSVDLTITVTPSVPAEAGGDVVLEYDVTQGDQNLYLELTSEANPDGYFVGYPDGIFNPSEEGAGTYTITYTVDESTACVTGTDSATFSITVVDECDLDAGADNTSTVCETDVQATFPDFPSIRTYFIGMLEEGVPTDGTFDPTMEELAAQYNSNTGGIGDYTTTYTVESGACSDSVELTVSVVPAEAATTGNIEDQAVCTSEETINLFSFLTDANTPGGTFYTEDGDMVADGMFTVSEGDFNLTYTVSEADPTTCLTGTASTEFVLSLNQGDANAGADNSSTVCETDVQATFPDFPSIRTYFIGMLEEGVPTDGTFNPTMEELAAQYNSNDGGIGDYTTTYTVGSGACSDSVELTVSVVPAEVATTGNIEDQALCTSEETINLFSFLTDANTPGGTFYTEDGDMVADGMFAVSEGDFNLTYTVTEADPSTCLTGTASTEFVLSLNQGDANAGDDITENLCSAQVENFIANPAEAIAYFSTLIPEDVDQNGTFDPSLESIAAQWLNDPIGTFTSTYTVGEGECQDSAVITFNVTEGGSVDAGADHTGVVCYTDVQTTFPDFPAVEAYLLDLLDEGVPTNGTFEPTIDELVAQYNADENGTGDFTTTYTVGSGECADSVELTVSVVPAVTATTGDIEDQALCTSEETINLFSFLTDANTPGGTFYTEDGDMIADGMFAVSEGDFNLTYTVTEADPTTCLTGTASTEFVLSLNQGDANAGDDITENLCSAQVEDFIANPAEAIAYFSTLIPEDVDQNGTFDPSLESIAAQWASNPIGTFTSTYTVGGGECQDSAVITFNVTEGGSVDAGADNTGVVCYTDVQATFPDFPSIKTYYLSLLEDGVPTNGTFEPTMEELAAQYNADEDKLGDYVTTYTVSNGTCTDSAQLTVRITAPEAANAGPDTTLTLCSSGGAVDLTSMLNDAANQNGYFENLEDNSFNPAEAGPGSYTFNYIVDATVSCVEGDDTAIYTVVVTEGAANAGADNSIVVCNSEVKNLPESGVRNLYLSLLEEGATTGGTFNPSIKEIINQYQITSHFGDFTTTYTVGDGDCQDSTVLTVTVLVSPDAGNNATVNLEEGDTEVVDLFEALNGTPDEGGTWTFAGNEVDASFDPATDAEGVYTYTVSNENCSDLAKVTVTIGEVETNCPEITNADQFFCSETATIADLVPADVLWYASADATEALPAETVLEDGVQYFAGDVEGTCENRGVVTVHFNGAPAAPVVTDFTSCVVTGATVADLDITGDNILVYSDETLETPLAATDLLEDGVVYYATQTSEGGCESEAAMITVTLTDAVTPSLVPGGDTFCAFDEATITELDNNIVETGTIVWYDAPTEGNILNGSEVLRDATTYYAALIDDTTGCESSVRLAVTINLEDCPLLIPEAFSPNGDGINDTFEIEHIADEYPNFTIEIFNRWGNVVYTGNASTPEWDGVSTASGSLGDKVLPIGVYFYILDFNDGETEPIQGRLYLSR